METTPTTDEAIDRTMLYYAFFRYPLLAREVWQHSNVSCTVEDVRAYLHEQQLLGRMYSKDGYFSTLRDVPQALKRRLAGSKKAEQDVKRAARVGRFIYQCPFVSFVGISGSLSKGYADARSDFDFFIITKKDRLWISRTMLHLFKKLTFLAGQQHKFCMNYFIDESALTLEEQNVYTATELCSLLPVCGTQVYMQFMHANSWHTSFLPNYKRKKMSALSEHSGVIKRLGAAIIEALNPDGLNAFLMKLTDSKWRKKWARKDFPASEYNLAFKTRLNISKNHHLNYQKKVLAALKRKEVEL